MRQTLKKITAIMLSLLMLAGAASTFALSALAEESATLQKGEFTFAPHTYTEGDLTDIYYYTDEVFKESAFDYNEHLATMSMILAAASISSQDSDSTYADKARNLGALLDDWGFEDFAVNGYYEQKPDEQSMGVGLAYKVIGEGEDAFTLLAIVPRSAGYEKEWAGNFTVDKEGLHKGFATGRDIILEFAKLYVGAFAESFVGEVKVWTVGYSRGAGVANLLAAYLDDNADALGMGVTLERENIFAYTFGTPSNVQYESEVEKAALESDYLNIHNAYAEYDIVTYAPFKNWGFTYHGTTKLFDVYNAQAKAEMLTFLEKSNPTIYELYTAEGSSADPDNFMPLMLKVGMGESGLSIDFAPADPAYGIPANQKEFLDSRIAYLVENLVPDRETYVDGGYQYALQRMTSLFFGLDAEQSALLISGMAQDVKTLAAVYYCYYLAECCLANGQTAAAAVGALLESLSTLELYMGALAENETISASAWYKFASQFLASATYGQLKGLLETVAANPDAIEKHVHGIRETIHAFAVGVTTNVLAGGVSALTLEETEKAELLTTMTSADVTAPLTSFLVHLLLGSEDGAVAPFDPSNKNVALAVTFLANAGRYMRVHNNEIILSWLRTEDSYYENEDWHLHQTTLNYDENGHWGECACGYKQENYVHVWSEWRIPSAADGEGSRVLLRTCHCGYEEAQNAPETEDTDTADGDNSVLVGTMTITIGTTNVVLLSICAVALITAAVAIIVISKKDKNEKK